MSILNSKEPVACEIGTRLLEAFPRRHPHAEKVMHDGDLCDPYRSTFMEFPEWQAFAEHYGRCADCNEL